jgi:choline transport protein
MSEEIANVAVNVPRSIATSVIINGALGFGMLIATIFCTGDIDAAFHAETTIGFPFIEIFLQATGSVGGSTGMTSIIIALAFSSTIRFLATASRMIWSFARDKGLPFSNILSKVQSTQTTLSRCLQSFFMLLFHILVHHRKPC